MTPRELLDADPSDTTVATELRDLLVKITDILCSGQDDYDILLELEALLEV